MVFDGHSDILTDVAIKRLNGEKNVFRNHHLERLKKGEVNGSIFVVWVDPPYTDEDPTWRMLEILGTLSEEIKDMKGYAEIAHNYEEMKRIQDQGKFSIILGIEGMSGLRGNTSLITMLYEFGIRHGMLTWNEENEFATGSNGNPERGITQLGIKALHKMEELGMIIDVSHGNEKTFWNICNHTRKPFIASHSNVYNLCQSKRNLKDDQIKAIAERNGVIGMNSWPDFIDKENPTVERLADHIDYIVNLAGIDYVGFGFDFCDFLSGDTTNSFQESETTMAKGIEDASKIPQLIKILSHRGYGQEQIEKITHKNFERVIKEILK